MNKFNLSILNHFIKKLCKKYNYNFAEVRILINNMNTPSDDVKNVLIDFARECCQNYNLKDK